MYLEKSKIIVIKIGSSLLIDSNKQIRKKWLSEFAKDIRELIEENKKIIIVSSGAIAMGCKKLNLSKKNLKIDKSQAVASIGQIELMNLFSEIFVKQKINISQILLTLEDTEQRRRALNAKRTFDNLFQLGFVPIVNENDTIATTEIKYGDNDRLASRVAQISGADTLILLSDVNFVKSVLFIAFFAYTSSSSAWDWLMAIDVHWFSTMFGWYCFSGMWISMMVVAVVIVQYLKKNGYLKEVNSSHVHDIGKWTFAISCLWSYLWFCQFMLIWYSNIPEEVTYYVQRFNDYRGLYLGTFFINFLMPFFILMSRDAKRNGIFLIPVALVIFVGHWLDVLIMVLPGTLFEEGTLGLVEIGMFLMFSGVFIYVVLNSLSKAPLQTKNHPMYDESLHLHH